MKKVYIFALLTLIICFYFLFKTDYKFKFYKIDDCKQIITVMEISKPFKRQVAFIKGEYHDYSLPSKDFVIKDLSSGFDAYFECIPTCVNGAIVINYSQGIYTDTVYDKNIYLNRIDYDNYSDMRLKSSLIIKIY